MFKNPLVQAFLSMLLGFLLLGPLGAVLGVIIWAVVYAKTH